MRYVAQRNIVYVVGHIWMPNAETAMEYDLSDEDVQALLEEFGAITREAIESWATIHTGDFESIDDFSASIEVGDNTVDIPWANEESYRIYMDLMYGSDEDEE